MIRLLRQGKLTPLGILMAWAAAFFAFSLLNTVSEAFMVTQGVALLFPAAAVAALAGVLLGWWGVLAVFAAQLLTGWGLATGPFRALFFAIAVSLLAAVPAAVPPRATGSSLRRTTHMVLYGAVVNTLLSAVVGVSGIVIWASPALSSHETALAFASWFLGDATTIIVAAFPALLFIRPSHLLTPEQIAVFRSWLRRWRGHLGCAALLGTTVLMLEIGAPAGMTNIHWLAIFFLAPVLWAAATGGIGGGLTANGVVGIIYVVEILSLVRPTSHAGLFSEVFSGYVNMAAFAFAAIVAGTFAGKTRVLVTDLDDHRRRLQANFESVVTALAAAIEAKDRATEGHVQRVARLAVQVGRRLGINGQRLELLRYAAILHDIGKIGVPESILNKAGELTPEEQELMAQHVRIGVEILQGVELLELAIPAIRYHQERWDGRTDCRYPGYFGLVGEQIPLEARIIAAIDAYDAIISDRPYRQARPQSEAVAELRSESGSQFDPEVVEALLAMVVDSKDADSSGRWPVIGERAPDWLTN
jgi:putative nucleotidyltransferase with HDIG domain